jgi:hypothetical protein
MKMNKHNLPRVKIPDLTIDEVKRIDVDEVSALANKMRRAVVDENR